MRRHTRKVKPKKWKKSICRTCGPWKFEETGLGLKRTCTVCERSITEVPHNVTVTQYVKGKAVGGKPIARLEVNK